MFSFKSEETKEMNERFRKLDEKSFEKRSGLFVENFFFGQKSPFFNEKIETFHCKSIENKNLFHGPLEYVDEKKGTLQIALEYPAEDPRFPTL